MHNFINLFFDLLRQLERDFDKKVFHRLKTAKKSYPHLFGGVAIGIYRYAATIFALRQVILLTQFYFAIAK